MIVCWPATSLLDLLPTFLGGRDAAPRRPDSAARCPTFKLHKIYLHPDWQGRGLGSRLLQHCEGEILKSGGRRLILSVNKRNAKAIAAYQRNGFIIAKSVVTDIGGGFVMDDYVMAKNLS